MRRQWRRRCGSGGEAIYGDLDFIALQSVKRLRAWSLVRWVNICALGCGFAMFACLIGAIAFELQNSQYGKVLFGAFFALGALAIITIFVASRLRNICNSCGGELERHHERGVTARGQGHFTISYVCFRCKKIERNHARWAD
jgi:hypothetical protein